MKKSIKIVATLLISCLLFQPLSVFAYTKKETVYTNLNPDGTVMQTTVTNHLLIDDREELLDETELQEILNLNGKETYTKDQTKLTWKTQGKDIFYQGTTKKDLPIKTKITYYLNDEEITPEEKLGASGSIKIVLTFENQLSNIMSVNGKKETLYTPFLVTVGTLLDNTNHKNLSVTNGKVIDSGTRNMVLALASPGLYESLGLEEFKKMNEITLSYETTNFTLNNIYIVATPKLIEEQDFALFDQVTLLNSKMKTLQQSMNQLETGAKNLESGSNSLVTGSTELAANLKNVVAAMSELEAGSTSLEQGLNQTITALKKASLTLNSTSQTESLSSLQTLKAKNKSTIQLLVAKTNQSLSSLKQYYMTQNLATYQGSEEPQATIKLTVELVSLLEANNKAIDSTIGTVTSLSKEVNTLLTTLQETLQKLETGANTLNSGLTTVKKGVSQLYQGSLVLSEGSKKLKQGVNTLSSGLTTFNNQGIKVLNSYSSKVYNETNKVSALLHLSQEYQGYSAENSNHTTFIYQVKSLKNK